jgi:diphthamide synthase (EF-2-diphthine--ammonia ligase)
LELLAEIPAECDPCGENGEMHTIVTAGPMFARPIPVRVGEIVERNGFAYADLIPEPPAAGG